jgi:hypothetical protein
MDLFRTRWTFRGLGTVLLGCWCPAVITGCGSGAAVSQQIDKDLARQTLSSVLEAWKSGERHDASERRSPAIRVADEDWLGGSKLLDYKIEPGEQDRGTSLSYRVSLELTDARGRTTTRQVSYNVSTTPTPMVIRQD